MGYSQQCTDRILESFDSSLVIVRLGGSRRRRYRIDDLSNGSEQIVNSAHDVTDRGAREELR